MRLCRWTEYFYQNLYCILAALALCWPLNQSIPEGKGKGQQMSEQNHSAELREYAQLQRELAEIKAKQERADELAASLTTALKLNKAALNTMVSILAENISEPTESKPAAKRQSGTRQRASEGDVSKRRDALLALVKAHSDGIRIKDAASELDQTYATVNSDANVLIKDAKLGKGDRGVLIPA